MLTPFLAHPTLQHRPRSDWKRSEITSYWVFFTGEAAIQGVEGLKSLASSPLQPLWDYGVIKAIFEFWSVAWNIGKKNWWKIVIFQGSIIDINFSPNSQPINRILKNRLDDASSINPNYQPPLSKNLLIELCGLSRGVLVIWIPPHLLLPPRLYTV